MKLLLCMILMVASLIAIATGEDRRHKYSTGERPFLFSEYLSYLGFKSFNKREFGKALGHLCRWRPIL